MKKAKITKKEINKINRPIDKDGYPIKRIEKCFECEKDFCLTFSFAQQNYSHKHFWYYWTEKERDKQKFICSPCLRNFYFSQRQEFLASVKNLQKRNNLRSLVSYHINLTFA